MARGKGLPPGVERRGNGTFRIRMSIPNGDGTYRRPSHTVKGTVADVWAVWTELDRQRNSGVLPNRTVTVKEWTDTWLETRRRNVEPNTADSDYHRTLRFIALHGHLRLTDITPTIVDAFYTTLHADGLAASTIAGIHSTLRKLFNDAVRKRLTPTNPVTGADVPTKRAAPKKVWTPETVDRFLTHTRPHRMYPLFHLVLHTGMRREELMGVEWGDIEGDTLNIQRRVVTTTNGVKTLPATKNKTAVRRIILDPDTITMLNRQRIAQTEEFFALGLRVQPDTRIVTKPDGTPYGPRHVNTIWKQQAKQAGAEPLIPIGHARHTWATIALSQGEEVKVVADRLGHSTAMTLNVYAQSTTASNRRAATVMSEAIRKGR